MKQFYTFTAAAVFLSIQTSAQFTQTFDAATSLTSGCNVTVNTDRTAIAGEVITGTGSLFSNPPVNGSGTRDYSTPYLNVTDPNDPLTVSTTLDVAFKYKLNEQLNGQAVRTIEVGLQGPSGFISLSLITMDRNNDPLTPVSFNSTFTVPTGVYRLVLRMGGSQGNGTVRIIIDDLVTNANAYYSLGGTCNMAPVVSNDVYFTSNYTSPTLFPTVLANDVDPNNESFTTPAVNVVSPDGTVVFNSDGSFTFTPNPGFTGTSTTFTYTVLDKGFDPMGGTGTVTINFTSGSILPVHLTAFNGNLADRRALLSWTVTNNEEGDRMEIEKSIDGRNFTTTSVVIPTTRSGDEKYQYKEANVLEATAYYRLKIFNKNNTVFYSGIVMLSVINSTPDVLILSENPVRNTLRFSFVAATHGTATINIYDIAGKKIANRQLAFQAGTNMMIVDLNNNVPSGTYLLELVTASERKLTRFMKQ